ncbi:DUF1919 domain-containing protein [Thiomicrorhabdus sp. 6S2-11]|uniref:DUF1919 domain-containing protein n=1 Tax=Thiomicrorhabdus marina TaxID=2818442 RepID=A0ABS3Q5Q4_9GAMM|nr:DUF1919 domain-containing protein [Thiomicrorhabdus marina]MBO1927649.1 DUF1919 domain-containing protein [Thiomicrorhabdus marina]
MRKQLLNLISQNRERKYLNNINFIIISNNCWGFSLYKTLKREYNTPFIGLYLYPDCYLKYLENFDYYSSKPISFKENSKYFSEEVSYPIGCIDNDIEIHFLHYDSKEDAYDKWNRRLARMKNDIRNKTPIFLKFCDSEKATLSHLARFHNLPFENKLSIGLTKYNSKCHFYTPKLQQANSNEIINGLALFRKRYHYFDITTWIIDKDCRKTLFSKLVSLIK